MLIATIIHWDRFNHGDAPLIGAIVFYGWVAVYIISPVVVLALWWFNRRTDSGEPAPGEAIVPSGVRRLAQAFAFGAFGASAVFYFAPEVGDRRLALGSHAADLARAGIADRPGGSRRPAALARPALEHLEADRADVLRRQQGILLVGAIRAWDDFDTGNPMTYLYVGGGVACRHRPAVPLPQHDGGRRRPSRHRSAGVVEDDARAPSAVRAVTVLTPWRSPTL